MHQCFLNGYKPHNVTFCIRDFAEQIGGLGPESTKESSFILFCFSLFSSAFEFGPVQSRLTLNDRLIFLGTYEITEALSSLPSNNAKSGHGSYEGSQTRINLRGS
jgi:hypothetical protein